MRVSGLVVCAIVAAACKQPPAEPEPEAEAKPVDPAVAKAASDRLDVLRRAVAAFPSKTATLPACSPGAEVRLLSKGNADVITGGPGDARTPRYARPNKDDGAFDDLRSDDRETLRRGVERLASLRAVALFATDDVKPPVAGTYVLISPATVTGRVVVFDLNAKPTCMSAITVTGGELTSVYVKKTARADEVKRAFEYEAEKDLTERLYREVAAVVKNAEK